MYIRNCLVDDNFSIDVVSRSGMSWYKMLVNMNT